MFPRGEDAGDDHRRLPRQDEPDEGGRLDEGQGRDNEIHRPAVQLQQTVDEVGDHSQHGHAGPSFSGLEGCRPGTVPGDQAWGVAALGHPSRRTWREVTALTGAW